MNERALHELKSDAHKLNVKLSSAVDAEAWDSVVTLCERLHELASRLNHFERTQKSLEWIRNHAAPSGERECR